MIAEVIERVIDEKYRHDIFEVAVSTDDYQVINGREMLLIESISQDFASDLRDSAETATAAAVTQSIEAAETMIQTAVDDMNAEITPKISEINATIDNIEILADELNQKSIELEATMNNLVHTDTEIAAIADQQLTTAVQDGIVASTQYVQDYITTNDKTRTNEEITALAKDAITTAIDQDDLLATSQEIIDLSTKVLANESTLTDMATSLASQESAYTTKMVEIDAKFAANEASELEQATVYANDQEALATQISTLTSAVNDNTISVQDISSTYATQDSVEAVRQVQVDHNGNITGWTAANGTSGSSFLIQADKFAITDQTRSAQPFSIDATTGEIQFNGKVTFGSVTGAQEAIAATIETVSVGDKNINVTDNLIPTTSLIADVENAGYDFEGSPTPSIDYGADSFPEVQIALASGDEVYSPYIEELTIPYYYRFAFKGLTANFSIYEISGDPVDTTAMTSSAISPTITLDDGIAMDANSWYIIDGFINPNGILPSSNGVIRTTGTSSKIIGSVSDIALSEGITWVCLGWTGPTTISRPKLAKVTADTVTGDAVDFNALNEAVTSIDLSEYVKSAEVADAINNNTTKIDGSKIITGSIDASSINTENLYVNAANVTGTLTGNVIEGAEMNGGVINGSIIRTGYIDLSGGASTLLSTYIGCTADSAGAINIADEGATPEYRLPVKSFIYPVSGFITSQGTSEMRNPDHDSTSHEQEYRRFNMNLPWDIYPYDSCSISTTNRLRTFSQPLRGPKSTNTKVLRIVSPKTDLHRYPQGWRDDYVNINFTHGSTILDSISIKFESGYAPNSYDTYSSGVYVNNSMVGRIYWWDDQGECRQGVNAINYSSHVDMAGITFNITIRQDGGCDGSLWSRASGEGLIIELYVDNDSSMISKNLSGQDSIGIGIDALFQSVTGWFGKTHATVSLYNPTDVSFNNLSTGA